MRVRKRVCGSRGGRAEASGHMISKPVKLQTAEPYLDAAPPASTLDLDLTRRSPHQTAVSTYSGTCRAAESRTRGTGVFSPLLCYRPLVALGRTIAPFATNSKASCPYLVAEARDAVRRPHVLDLPRSSHCARARAIHRRMRVRSSSSSSSVRAGECSVKPDRVSPSACLRVGIPSPPCTQSVVGSASPSRAHTGSSTQHSTLVRRGLGAAGAHGRRPCPCPCPWPPIPIPMRTGPRGHGVHTDAPRGAGACAG